MKLFKFKYCWVCFAIVICYQHGYAQKDSLFVKQEKKKSFLPQMILPTTFILTGVFLNNAITEKKWQVKVRNKVGNNFYNGIDNYIQYAPYAEIYFGDLLGVKAKNHWFDQTKNIFFSGLITTVIVHSLKRGVGKARPDDSNHHSFPSGHTANSFLGATILCQEFKDSSPVLAYSGYFFSTATGSLRVMNNKHWVSDVFVGAGIGILVANLIYRIEPLKNWNPFKANNKLTFSPIINGNEVTFVATYKL